ncbi:MAG TPA: hypothetical protein VGZ22_20550 [Isosphaeraceae bacterium]|jgi:hypothetical protein|nr:hypothetical protein [Isosphaeraceae bacterium]
MIDRQPSRLCVIPARDAPVAVIIRRGPSDWFHLILWETRRDVFTCGAWFHGRLYPERCDLSPDGRLFVYFAFQGSRVGTAFTSSWTAVSRPPWLHALALWPWETTHGGGGRFLEDRRLVLHSGMPVEPHPEFRPTNLQVECGGASYHASAEVVPEADWSGYDQRGNVVFARHGRLFRRCKSRKSTDVELADFNSLSPDPKPAPDWAKRPL